MSCKSLLKASVLCTMILISHLSFSQNKVVSGRVTDSRDGSGLSGVTVAGKGTKIATQTAADGSFSLSLASSVTTLVFTSVGFATQEVPLNGDKSLSVSMVVTNASLGEVVVVGYGTAR